MTERDIFVEALSKGGATERRAYLDRACASDPDLRSRVELLLRAHGEGGDFLGRPAAEVLVASAWSRASDTEAFGPPGAAGEPSGVGLSEETWPDPTRDDPGLGSLEPPRREGSLGRLGHYEILGVVGRGGMGVVLRAFDEKLHRVVAIKVMAAELAAGVAARRRFIREARAAAAVTHEHVVPIYAVEEDSRTPFLVMPFVEGISLQEKLDRSGPQSVPVILRVGLQVAAGLAAAHGHGLVHRDIKPANILLENGVERVKITDFGLARAVDDASLTQSGVIAGTPHYMSPEQAAGLPVDHRSDLFSLGSVLHAMGTGHPPFRARTPMAVLRRVADEPARPVREVNPDIPEWLSDIIARLHEADPDRRFQTAAEVAEILTRCLADLQRPDGGPIAASGDRIGVTTAIPTSGAGARSPRGRDRRRAVAAAACLVLAAGLGATEATGVTQIAGTVVHLFHPEGTLIVEVEDPSVSVAIDGRDVVITGAGPREIRLKPGQYRVTARKDGRVIRQELVSVTRAGRPVVRVSRGGGTEPDPRRDVAGGPSELDRLLQLAQRKYEQMQERVRAGVSSNVEVLAAQDELIEARLRHTAAAEDDGKLGRLFAELVSVRQARREMMQTIYRVGRASQAELDDAERALLEAQIRWKAWRTARGEPDPAPPPESPGPPGG